MQIGIVAPAPPSGERGGAERLWDTLAASLRDRGHETEVLTIPFPESSLLEVLDGYERFGQVDASGFDVVITGKYPAWMLNHPRHLVYLLHPLRGLYDTYPTARGELADTPEGRAVEHRLGAAVGDPPSLIGAARHELARLGDDPLADFPGPIGRFVVQHLDRLAFGPERVASFAAISEEVAARPGYLPPGRPVLVAHPESDLPVVEGEAPASTVFFTASRLDRPKRLDLLLAAFARIADDTARLRIAGDGPDRGRLEELAAGDSRVELLGRISDRQLATEYANATAVPFVPAAEDYGYIAVEAMRVGTPVVTTNDSGGAKELIEHGVNGMIVEPTARRLAWAMSHVADSRRVRWEMGLNARRRAQRVNWDPLLDEIVDVASPVDRPRALVLSTYPVDPMVGGGQRRARFLTGALAERADVRILVSSSKTTGTRRRRLQPGLDQIEIGRSPAQRQAEDDMFALLNMPVDDLTAAALAPATPAFGAELDRQLRQSDVVIATQPFLLPVVRAIRQPIVYDSQNAEISMKTELLPPTAGGRWLLDHAIVAESDAATRAALITACTDSDLEEIQVLSPSDESASVVVGNGVDTRAIPFKSSNDARAARTELLAVAGFDPDDDRPLAIFIGSWHPPNIRAAELALAVASLRPDWLFVLAGSHTSEFADRAAAGSIPDNVHLIAIFSESLLWPLLAGADVALNPMVSGGGSNLKLFDYLAVGTPVVTTETGARGLIEPERYATVVEPTVEALAEGLTVATAEADSAARAGRLDAGRRLVEAEFDWAELGRRWSDAVLDLVDDVPPPRSTTSRPPTVPPLATTPPPSADPVIATMELIGGRAQTTDPPAQDITMDPMLRENLNRASENRNVGRQLPEDARLKVPKQALIRLGHALSNEQVAFNEATLEALEQLAVELHRLQGDNDSLARQVSTLDDTNRALRHQVDQLRAAPPNEQRQPARAVTARRLAEPDLDRFYEAFEDAHRGTPEEVRGLLADHLHRFEPLGESPMPVVDIGSGPGVWLEMLGEIGVAAYGVDTNSEAVTRATARQLDVRHEDGLTHLDGLEPGSVAAVTAIHVVEHLPFDRLLALLEAAYRAIAPGGFVLLETPNCLNLQVTGSSFWIDPTHLRPAHPTLLQFCLQQTGFVDVEIEGLHPASSDESDARLENLADDPERNGILSAMAKLMFGSHDVAVVATKPA